MRWLAFVMVSFIAPLAHADDASDAMALHDKVTKGGRGKEAAQLDLATLLYKMGLKQASYAYFSEIADKPAHSKFSEALPWLAKLGADLPEAADVAERVGKYDDAHIMALSAQRDTFAQIEWMSGQYAYRNRNYEDAIARFSRIDRSSPLFGKAQMMVGMSNVQARRSVPAVTAFGRTIAWLDEGGATPPDALRLRDLANLSMARTYYSASISPADTGFAVDFQKLSAAIKYFRRVSPTGEFFFDAMFGDAWARRWAGDYDHALGEARFVSPRFAEAGVLEALIQYGNCRYDDAARTVTRLRETYEPKKRALASELAALEKASDDAQYALAVRSPEATDRRVASFVAYEALLQSEKKKLASLPAAFRSSPLGADISDVIALGLDIVHRQVADLARERIMRAKDELDENLRDAMKISIDVVAAQKNALEQQVAGSPPPPLPPPARPRTLTLSWPLNGGHTPDPLYAAPITPACRP